MPTRTLFGSLAAAVFAAPFVRIPRVAPVASIALVSWVALACGGVAHAAPSVKIAAPLDGAKLDAMEQSRLVYEVEAGPRADHVHVYIDDKEVGILRELKGSYTLPTLAPGKHRLCVKIVNKAHTPTGVEDCVTALVE